MPPLLWTILELLFGFWVFRNREKIQRGIAHLISPPPLEAETLPDSDQNPSATGFLVIGAILGFLVGVGLSFVFPSSYLSAGSICGMLSGSIIAYRRDFHRLAPNQPWRVLTENLAARAGIENVTVRMVRSKSRQIRVSPKGVITIPSALLRTTTPDELAFHIGRALWEIPSGYARKDNQERSFRFSLCASLFLAQGVMIFSRIFQSQIIAFMVMGFTLIIFLLKILSSPNKTNIFNADQFALGLTGDLSTALRVIEVEEERRVASKADFRYGLRARQNGYERAKRLSEWWALQQRQAVSPIVQATPQVQRLGKP